MIVLRGESLIFDKISCVPVYLLNLMIDQIVLPNLRLVYRFIRY